jgi:addiction module RelE/StbE family toxin
MEILAAEDFLKEFERIKDKSTKDKLIKHIDRLLENPDIGKPLTHDLKGERSVHIHPFRLIYSVEGDKITLLRFEHRKEVYR